MKAVDERPVWSIVCFVVPSQYRGQGVARALLDGAIAYARERGVALLEAYPVDKPRRSADDSMWFGAKSMYDAAGFEEVARRKPNRPIVRIRAAAGRIEPGGKIIPAERIGPRMQNTLHAAIAMGLLLLTQTTWAQETRETTCAPVDVTSLRDRVQLQCAEEVRDAGENVRLFVVPAADADFANRFL